MTAKLNSAKTFDEILNENTNKTTDISKDDYKKN